MQYHKQLIEHNPEQGLFGDCFRTCIACLLDMTPDQILHVCDSKLATEQDAAKAIKNMNAFMENKFGLQYIEFPFSSEFSLQDVLNNAWARFGDIRYVLLGITQNKTNHCVVCHKDKIEHNPSDKVDIIGPAQMAGFGDFWWVGCLVKKV